MPVVTQTNSQDTAVERKVTMDAKDKDLGSLKSPATMDSTMLEKGAVAPMYYDENGETHYNAPPRSATDIVTEVIEAIDDRSLSPWTFRMWFLGRQWSHPMLIFWITDPSRQDLGFRLSEAF